MLSIARIPGGAALGLTAVVCILASGCHPRAREAPQAEDNDDDASVTLALPAPVDAAAPPAMPLCTLAPTRWLARTSSASPVPTLEGGALARGATGDWLGWIDRGTPPAALVLAPPSGEPLRQPLGAGETDAPVLASSGDGALAVSVVQRGATRVHRVISAVGGAMHELFQQREPPDDGLTVAVASTAQGVVIAWDEERANKGAVVTAQFVPHAAVARGSAMPAPATRALSPDDEDAADPLLLTLPDGNVLLVWLAAQDDATPEAEGNVTASDIVVRRLDAAGNALSSPVAVTPGPGRRFAVTAAPGTNGSVWLAYRVAGDSDQESRGDGGSVAVLKLGADLHPVTSAVFVTEPGAVASGAPVLVPAGDGVQVFWIERNGEGVRTFRRLLRGNAVPAAPGQVESVLAGDLPAYGDSASVTLVVHGPQGELGTARAECPVSVAAPNPSGGVARPDGAIAQPGRP